MKKDSLIIWVPSEDRFATLKFENVTKLQDDDIEISFEYDGVSTREHRLAHFDRDKMLGFAITEAVE